MRRKNVCKRRSRLAESLRFGDRGKGGRAILANLDVPVWTKIGAAWSHAQGGDFNIELQTAGLC